MVDTQNRQKTMGEPRRESFVIPPSPDVFKCCAGGDAQQKKAPAPAVPGGSQCRGHPARIFLVVVRPTIVGDQSAAAGSGATPR